jgi:hypothetical protein
MMNNRRKLMQTQSLSDIFQFSEKELFQVGSEQSIRPPSPDKVVVKAEQLPLLLQDDCYIMPMYFPSIKKQNVTVKVVRFILTDDEMLLFGGEGAPGGKVPAHWHMTQFENYQDAKCISAGNIYFYKNKLCGISHKSGDFRPSFDSLQFVLQQLSTIPMAGTIEILELNEKGGVIKSHLVARKHLIDLNMDGEIKTLDYTLAHSQSSSSRSSSKSDRSLKSSSSSFSMLIPRFNNLFSDSKSENDKSDNHMSSTFPARQRCNMDMA